MTKGLETYLGKNPFWVKTLGASCMIASKYFIIRANYYDQHVVDDIEEDVWYKVEEGSVQHTTGRLFEDWMSSPVLDMDMVKDTGCVMKLENGTEVNVLLNPQTNENILVDKKLFKMVTDNTEFRYFAILPDKYPVFLLDNDYLIQAMVLPVRSDPALYKVVRQYDDSRLD